MNFYETFFQMQNNRNKKSNLLNIRNYFEKFNSKNNIANKTTKQKNGSNLNNLPREILLKIFDLLTLDELFMCSLVCKDWYNASKEPTLWINLAKLYKCSSEILQITKDFDVDYKNAFKRFFFVKREVVLFKLGEKLSKKRNNYSGLPDLKSFQTDIINLDWYLEFFDKRSNRLLAVKMSEFNNFEAGFSIVWSNLSELTYQVISEIEKVLLYVIVPVYLDCKNGKLSSQKSKTFTYNINTKKIIIEEYDNFLRIRQTLKTRNSVNDKIHEDSLINIQNVNNKLLIGSWSTDSKKDPIFITYSSIFNQNLVEKIYKQNSSK